MRELSPQWLALLLIIRLAGAGTAVILLIGHRVSSHDESLTMAVVIYTIVTAPLIRWLPRVLLSPVAWALDIGVVLTLVAYSGDWRSPFYLLALTTLATPAAALRPSRALLLGVGYSLVYGVMAHFIGPDPLDIGAQTTVETLATHLLLPIMVSFGVSYAAEAVRALRAERRRAERLAIEAERRRIAWELHDSAKQRVHAAHLVLDSIPPPADDRAARAIDQVLAELRAAATDMDTSVAELRSPLEGRPLDVALRQRCAELTVDGGPRIAVNGELHGLEPLAAAHAYRIAAEALTNAARHAMATRVEVMLVEHSGSAVVVVADDGSGLPRQLRPGANGLRAMSHRAATIGGTLDVESGPNGKGTRVELRFPITRNQKENA